MKVLRIYLVHSKYTVCICYHFAILTKYAILTKNWNGLVQQSLDVSIITSPNYFLLPFL